MNVNIFEILFFIYDDYGNLMYKSKDNITDLMSSIFPGKDQKVIRICRASGIGEMYE